jgi:hypothetical protein
MNVRKYEKLYISQKADVQLPASANVNLIFSVIRNIVPDPCHFAMDPDPDPCIRTLDYGSGSCSFRQWLFCLLLTVGTFTLVFKDNKSLRSHKTVEVKVFLNIFAC